MRIENLRTEARGQRATILATVRWEDCERPAQELYFATGEEFAEALSPGPHPFLVASVLPALKHGEERLVVEGEVCPELRDGLATSMAWIRQWYGLERRPVRIEARASRRLPIRRMAERAAVFFSGGIDSLATLRWNRLNFPLEHPGSVKDGLLVFGAEIDEPGAFELVQQSLLKIAHDAGVTLIPIYTNARYLDDDWVFWRDEFQGAFLSAVAHAVTERVSSVAIGGTLDIPNLRPWGSHPLLDANYGSSDLRIRHDGVAWSRLAKTRLVADWDVALQNLRVCNKIATYRPDSLNCGECEKCIRTMLALLVLGALDRTRAFPTHDLSEEMVARVWITDPYEESCHQDLIGPLQESGRGDLVRGIRRAIAQSHGHIELRTRIWRFDRRYLGGHLSKFKRLVVS